MPKLDLQPAPEGAAATDQLDAITAAAALLRATGPAAAAVITALGPADARVALRLTGAVCNDGQRAGR